MRTNHLDELASLPGLPPGTPHERLQTHYRSLAKVCANHKDITCKPLEIHEKYIYLDQIKTTNFSTLIIAKANSMAYQHKVNGNNCMGARTRSC